MKIILQFTPESVGGLVVGNIFVRDAALIGQDGWTMNLFEAQQYEDTLAAQQAILAAQKAWLGAIGRNYQFHIRYIRSNGKLLPIPRKKIR